MREVFPLDSAGEGPLSEELKEEVRAWVEEPKPSEKPVRTEKAADQSGAVRYDLD